MKIEMAGNLFRQRAALRFRSEPDQNKADNVNERNHCAGLAIISFIELHQVTHLQGANRRENAAKVIADSLRSRAHASWKKFG